MVPKKVLDRIFVLLVALLTIFMFSVSGSRAQTGKSYHAASFDIDIIVEPGGTLLVTEDVSFQFVGGPFTYAYRELALNATDGIEILRVAIDGLNLPFLTGSGAGAGMAEISGQDPLRVTWRMPETYDQARTFSLTYRVRGVVRPGEPERIIWRAVPEEHEYSIVRSRIIIHTPAGVVLASEPVLEGAVALVEQGADQVTLTAMKIPADTPLDVHLAFQPGALGASEPLWYAHQQASDRQAALAQRLGWPAAGLAVIGLVGAAWLYLRRFRERDSLPVELTQQPTSPPGELPPALAARLTGGQPGTAILFDLAQRGVVTIEEEPKTWRGRQYSLVRQASNEQLSPWEQAFLEVVFAGRRGTQQEVSFTDLGERLQNRKEVIDKLLEAELIRRGWLDQRRQAAGKRLIALSLLALFAGILLAVAVLIYLTAALGDLPDWAAMLLGALAGLGGGAFVGSVGALIVASTHSPLSALGEGQVASWKGFASYLKDVARGKAAAQRPDLFERYLPLAAGFGLGQAWAKHYQKLGNVQVPGWFHALQDGDFDGVVAMMAATNVSTSSDGGAAAGASGASGGGGSGAG